MPEALRLGTRTSKLALWQANQVADALRGHGFVINQVELQSEGDINTTTPLDHFGVPGVFTDRFDQALYDNQIDFAVHSLKDYPATVPEGLIVAAHLQRGNPIDTLVLRKPIDHLDELKAYVIATCSSRRKAQWLSRFPNSVMTDIRGNVPTRLAKLYDSEWDGAIFARAGLDRLGLRPPHTIDLGWMIPAPGQAVVAAVCRKNDEKTIRALSLIDDVSTRYVSGIERAFLAALGGGCEAPIGGLAFLLENTVHFKGCVFLQDGQKQYAIDTTIERGSIRTLTSILVEKITREFEADISPLNQTA